MGRNNGQVAVLRLLFGQEGLQGVAKGRTTGQPQGQAGAYALGEGEQLHVLANLAVVPLFGLFQYLQILGEHAGLGEGDAVDTGELLAFFIAPPVSAGQREHLHGLDDLRVLQVRATAQVRELAVGIIGDGAVFQLRDEFLLVRVPFLGEVFEGVRLGHLYALEVLLLAGEFQHFVLDGLEVRVRQGAAVHVHIVIEAVFDGRADAELHAREQGLQGLCHQVRRAVPEYFLGFVVLPFEEPNGAVLRDGTGKVNGGSTGSFGLSGILHLNRQYLLCQTRADAHGNLITSYASLVLTNTSIRERNVNHNSF